MHDYVLFNRICSSFLSLSCFSLPFLGLFEKPVIENTLLFFYDRKDVHEDRVPRGWKWGEKRLLNLTVINGNIDGFVSRSRENPPPPPPLLFQWTEKKKGIWITRRWHIVTRGHVSSRYSSTAEEERT